MRVAIFIEPGRPFEIITKTDPSPQNDELVIAVQSCGICGSDVSLTSGSDFDFPRGTAMGHEYAGEVVAVGSAVKRFRIGDRAACMAAVGCGACIGCSQTGNPVHCSAPRMLSGGFGEYVAVPEKSAVLLPDLLTVIDGALIEPFAVGLHAMESVANLPGSRVFILGAGAVGMACAYWSRRFGAARVVMAARTAAHADIAKSMGVDEFTSLGETPISRMDSPLRKSADIVFECVGRPGLLGDAISCAVSRGQIISLGMCCRPDAIVPAAGSFKEVRLAFPLAYSQEEFHRTPEMLAAASSMPRDIVTKVISLDELPSTIERMRMGEGHLKVQVNPRRSP